VTVKDKPVIGQFTVTFSSLIQSDHKGDIQNDTCPTRCTATDIKRLIIDNENYVNDTAALSFRILS
jgi:hypothetical protein